MITAAAADAPPTPTDKAAATATARAALAGFELVRMADGGYVISKWGLLRSLDSLTAVEAFLAQVGAPR